MALAAIVAALLMLAGYASGQQKLTVEVDQCSGYDGVESPEGADCSSQTTVAPQPAPEPAPRSQPQPAPDSGRETHDYNLETGRARVETADGEVTEETLNLDLSPHGDGGADDHEDYDHKLGAKRAKDLLADDNSLPTVTTSGGSEFAGFGADMVSGDEALSRFAVPPFLVPIYVAAGRAYNVPWNVLAAINQIETDFGRIRRQVSYAGALGWMQFMPGTWRAYGVDASGDGVADPFNPVDAIYAAARYLSASGAPDDMRRAVFAYNHADWYVDRVLQSAAIYGSLPAGLLAEAGSLAFGRFPVLGRVSYGDDFRRVQAAGSKPRGLWISGRAGARAVATQHVKVVRVLLDRRLARLFQRDGLERRGVRRPRTRELRLSAAAGVASKDSKRATATTVARQRTGPGLPAGYGVSKVPGLTVEVEDPAGNRYSYGGLAALRPAVRPGARIAGGRTIGQLPPGSGARMLFSVRAAGGAPVDPRPLVDGYRLQEAADFYHAVAPLGDNPFVPDSTVDGTTGVSGSQRQLAARVLGDSGIQIYPGGRDDIQRGVIDRRVLGALLYLRRNGIETTVTSLRSGHSFYTAGGSVSAHSFGAAVDIAAFNGQPVIGNQGPGSLTEQAIKLLMRLEGSAQPSQLISLMNLGGPSFAMGDHADHLHVGYQFQQSLGAGRTGNVLGRVDFEGVGAGGDLFSQAKVSRRHEDELSRRFGGISNPEVSRKQGPGSLRVEAERPGERQAAERLARRRGGPFTASPTATGARLADVDIPERARGDEAYAVGTVDGGGLRGWSKRQTVVLRHAGATWRILGPPVDSAGRIVNPSLRALASVRGGRGYAVGERGAVVELRGGRAPRLLGRATKARLNAVDATKRGGSVQGIAVGDRGSVLRLHGDTQRSERAGSRRTKLHAVLLDGASALASGLSGGEGAVYRRGAGGWSAADLDLGLAEGLQVRLTSLERSKGELWASGAVSDVGTLGTAAEIPIAARLAGGRWTTFCAGRPALAAVAELGTPTDRELCDAPLSGDPSDHGAAGEIAVTRLGVLATTSRGLYVYDQRSFRPVLTYRTGYQRLAVSRSGRGWALAADGRAARVEPARGEQTARVERLPLGRDGGLPTIASAPSGDSIVALAGGDGAVRGADGWTRTTGAITGLRAAAFAGDESAWAADASGTLLELHDGRWTVKGDDGASEGVRRLLARVLGGRVLATDSNLGRGAGLQALAFAADDEGYAVGADGLVVRFDGDGWSREWTAAAVSLNTVAAGGGSVVAAGDQGVLIERGDDGWEAPDEARALAAGKSFTAADALPDGTLLAAAGGAVLEREPGDSWRRAHVQPLGMPVQRLAGYRTRSGELKILVLAGSDEERALLQGDASGWRPVTVPAELAVGDFALQRDSLRLWVAGQRDGQPVAARLALGRAR